MHAYSSSSREEEVWRRESKFNLSYMVRPCQKKKKPNNQKESGLSVLLFKYSN